VSKETTTTIAGLVAANPTAGDPFSEGDDHLRTIKTVLKTIFPGSGGGGFSTPLTASEAELNYVNGVTSPIQTQLNTLTAGVTALVPRGVICLWVGTVANIPDGWVLCDGDNGTVDLSGRFVLGYGGAYTSMYAAGGYTDGQILTHTHVATAAAHAHTYAEVVSAVGAGVIAHQTNGDYAIVSASTGNTTVTVTNAAPSGAVAVTGRNMPPYFVLAYIMKS
jgi:microcystin-dependent protein